MRFLLINNHCISDPTAGVTQSLRTIVEWLADAGHHCQVLTTARFESPVTFTIEEHLRQRGVVVPAAPPRRSGVRRGGHPSRPGAPEKSRERPIVRYNVRGAEVTLLLTRHNDEAQPDYTEAWQFLSVFDDLLLTFEPDVVVACNGHPMIFEALKLARRAGAATAYAVRGYGYEQARYFEHVDHVFTCSAFLTGLYRDRIGLRSTPIEPPIDWAAVTAPTESRAFVTFVHPALHKGLLLFARLADLLGSRRPDIPILVVQSGGSGGALNGIPEIDFGRYPQIMAAPAVPEPSAFFALTRLLLVPSVWEEPFGRVAAEAMINGIPPLVSDRGALPQVIGGDFAQGGGGCVLPVPAGMTDVSRHVPSAAEVEPWYAAVCRLWDNAALYDAVSARGRELAEERYNEALSRKRHVDYFTSLRPGGDPVVPAAPFA